MSKIDQSTPGLIQLDDKISYKDQHIYAQTDFPKSYEYFHIMGHQESHLKRRIEILQKHPEIKILFEPDQTSLWLVITFVTIQILLSILLKDTHWIIFISSCYLISGTLTHSLHVLVHDFTHFSCFHDLFLNKVAAIVANIGQGIPTAISFGIYHADHHKYLNIDTYDPDLPSKWELQYIKGPFMKTIFILCLPLFYSLRPVLTRPHQPTIYEFTNIIVVILTNYILHQLFGIYPVIWLALGTYFGLSIHPFAGHLIAEHYEFINKLETYDYIGWINFFNLNIGYHIEHHDFPMIPWTRLPLLRKMAPEYYEKYPCHPNYVYTIYNYIFDKQIGPFSRIHRDQKIE